LVGGVIFHVGDRVGMAWKEGWHHVQAKRSCYPHTHSISIIIPRSIVSLINFTVPIAFIISISCTVRELRLGAWNLQLSTDNIARISRKAELL